MALNLDAVGQKIGPYTKEYSWKDPVLYALGVGAGFEDLDYCYEKDLKVLPSFGIITLYDFMPDLAAVSQVNLAGVLHGEQELIFHNPIPPSGTLSTEGAITHYYDKGESKGALIKAAFDTYHSDGQKLFTSIVTVFARLDGGFGGENAPKTDVTFPDREPDFVELATPSADQPLLYRLSGDVFQLHVDQEFAEMSGFDKPIMHGLCTHGYACRSLIRHLVPGEPAKVRRMVNRFRKPLYPGTPIEIRIWKEGQGRALWRVVNVDTGDVVIENGIFEYGDAPEETITFEDRVAIVTGAGAGLGRVYALELAERGARVVVNDLGGARDGTGRGSASAADQVVAEIKAAGGQAVANYNSVATTDGGENIVKTALDAYGTVDIVINNAGILRDKTFLKMEPENWKAVLDVHLNGAYNVTRPAFAVMKEKGYGRVLLTTSAAGLYGNFGQTNYTAAKMGLVGLMNTLKIEGAKNNIKVNTIAPVAASRLTEDVLPPDFLEKLSPELVAPLALYLVSEQCPVSGHIYNAGMGSFNRAAIVTGPGAVITADDNTAPAPEQILAQFDQIASLDGGKTYDDVTAQIGDLLGALASPDQKASNGNGGYDKVGAVFEALPGAFVADAAAGVDVVFQFAISGADGGDWSCAIKNSTCTVTGGVDEKPTCTLKMADGDFLAMMNGTLPAMQAYTSGKLIIEGDIMKSQLIEKLFKLEQKEKTMIGITSYGAYIPRLRLDRMAIFQQMGWFAPAIMMVAQGERSMCNWDEDAITMAVEAARDCMSGLDKHALDALYLASTTLPFADRQNAGILGAALNLNENLVTADFGASQKAATTALITALESVGSGERNNILVAASDRRETKTAYFYEMWFGDGAAALAVGNQDVIAEFKGSHSLAIDFVDHYRGAQNQYDYVWEERWTRDMGYGQIIPEVIDGLFEKLGIGMDAVDKLVYPCFFKGDHRKIAQKMGAAPEKLVDNMHEVCGETGAAHAFLMLVSALEQAEPGERILVCGFGQGANALYFEVTDNIGNIGKRNGVKGCLENKKTIDNYQKWLKFRDLIKVEMGIRAEAPTQTATTVLWRKNKMLLGLVGGKCSQCGTPQYPRMDICVNPECGAVDTQEDYEFADVPATVKTFTGDMLSVSVDPPAIYGMVQFEGGGRMLADFTDCELEDIRVGLPMRMAFKRKMTDKERGFVNYFWKAVPLRGALPAAGDSLRFDDQVAVVTGAGAGLGRTYALELAKRGAKVVVNDLGGARDGSGAGSSTPADQVVNQIKDFGGEAVANYDNVATVEGGENIVKTAVETFGRLDILINNAGILRDKSFLKMEPENWQAVMDVHLNGAYFVTRPAMTAMKKNGYGRIVMTTSAAGLYGNFGQTNYSAAKTGLVGLANAIKLEGAKYNIKVNTIAPIAASRLTEDVMPPDLFEKSSPDFVSPMVLYLCSEQCQGSGEIFNAGLGFFNRAAVLTGRAVQLGDPKNPPTVEQIHQSWKQIDSLEGARPLDDATTAIFDLLTPPSAEAEASAATSAAGDVGAIFEGMQSTFKAEAAAGVDVVFQFNIGGAGGGQWFCEIKDGKCTIDSGAHAQPACTVEMNVADFTAMMQGRLPAMQAYTSGKLKLGGDIMKSQLLEKLFKIG